MSNLTSIIDHNNQAYFISNNLTNNATVLKDIQVELSKCDSFAMSVAFITEEGITMILQQLADLNARGVSGRILTSKYQLFNNPKAYRKLMGIENIEVRIYEKEAHHTKGYIFSAGDSKTVIIGSSNLTSAALKQNREWNLKLEGVQDTEMIEKIKEEFDEMWDVAEHLTEQWISEYSIEFDKAKLLRTQIKTLEIKEQRIIPNTMQTNALRNLEMLRNEGKKKALLVSATGTGKTYLSAFDVRNYQSKKTLFVIHREQIARDAERTFRKVMPDLSTGFISGSFKDIDKDIIFTTIQSISKDNVMNLFPRDYFDYIIIDEAHRSGANSYLKVMEYFNPGFYLGMTATPERTDGFNVFELFDYNIAYEIRLNGALEEDMLTPFHYFGVTDVSIDGELIDEQSTISKLINKYRIDSIVEKSKYYGFSGNRLKGLIFCSLNEEARKLSEELNKRGYRTISLDGSNTQDEREKAIVRLTEDDGDLDYILTVDIFNEGIDIPEINQIIMLRPTQSAIIFVQQLGRGLRKHFEKDYVVVIDFIGNYKNNFLIPIALSGDRSFSKNSLRKYVMEGNNLLPGVSTIEFDRISKERIYEAINVENFGSKKHLKKEYENLKFKLGRIPKLVDFIKYDSLDPEVIFNESRHRNYHRFKIIMDEEYSVSYSDIQDQALTFVSYEISSGKRDIELKMIKELIENESIDFNKYVLEYGLKSSESAVRYIKLDFLTKLEADKYSSLSFIVEEENQLRISLEFEKALENELFKSELEDVLEYGLQRNAIHYNDTDDLGLVVGEQYSRKDASWLLNFETNQMATIYGYKTDHYSKTIPLFVTYKKSEDIEESIMYHDYFIDKHTFNWMSRNRRTLESQEIKTLISSYKEQGYKVLLFIKRSDGEKANFYYIGQVDILSYKDSSMLSTNKQESVVEFILQIKNPVRDDLYHYLIEE